MRWPAVLALVLLAPVGPALAGPATAPPDPFEAFGLVSFDSGIRAPEFTLRDVNGGQVSVSPRGGSADVLVFWATW
ncbi:MAG: hypothetical protein ACREK6_08245 [Candidatus Rokuibacteriota bacterium]